MNTDLGGELSRIVIGAAIGVHREVGPGLLEAVYEECLACELRLQGIAYERQVLLPLIYKGIAIGCRYRIDFVVENSLIVEVKAIEHVAPIHEAQLLTYLRLSGFQLGLLINFNSVLLNHGIRRLALSPAGTKRAS
ncbi:MAG TPA: GxxExxY protein [Acetobacteraceae bacterium]